MADQNTPRDCRNMNRMRPLINDYLVQIADLVTDVRAKLNGCEMGNYREASVIYELSQLHQRLLNVLANVEESFAPGHDADEY